MPVPVKVGNGQAESGGELGLSGQGLGFEVHRSIQEYGCCVGVVFSFADLGAGGSDYFLGGSVSPGGVRRKPFGEPRDGDGESIASPTQYPLFRARIDF